MIEIKEYPITINARIKEEQYDRIKESGVSKSEYVRDAIDFFNCNVKKEIELSKIELLNEIERSIALENDKFDEFVKKHSLKESVVLGTIKEVYAKSYSKLEKIEEEEEKYSDVNIVKPQKRSCEEDILKILPTLQGFYHSETGITYDKVRILAFRINISPEVLMTWINQNEELVQGRNYQNRPLLKHKGDSLKNYDK